MKPRTEPFDVPGIGLVPMLYVNTWAAYEAFRRLGFTADEVQFICCGNGDLGFVRPNVIHVRVQAQGLEFMYTVAPADRRYEEAQEYLKTYLQTMAALMKSESPLVMEMYRSTEMGELSGEHFMSLTMAMINKGFRLRVIEN